MAYDVNRTTFARVNTSRSALRAMRAPGQFRPVADAVLDHLMFLKESLEQELEIEARVPTAERELRMRLVNATSIEAQLVWATKNIVEKQLLNTMMPGNFERAFVYLASRLHAKDAERLGATVFGRVRSHKGLTEKLTDLTLRTELEEILCQDATERLSGTRHSHVEQQAFTDALRTYAQFREGTTNTRAEIKGLLMSKRFTMASTIAELELQIHKRPITDTRIDSWAEAATDRLILNVFNTLELEDMFVMFMLDDLLPAEVQPEVSSFDMVRSVLEVNDRNSFNSWAFGQTADSPIQ